MWHVLASAAKCDDILQHVGKRRKLNYVACTRTVLRFPSNSDIEGLSVHASSKPIYI